MKKGNNDNSDGAWRSRPALLFATGFGLGLSPIASGTVGSLPGVLLVVLLYPQFGVVAQIIFAVVLALAAIPICHAAEGVFKTKDDGRIVADEYMTFPLCMIGLPVTLAYWWVLPMAFVVCRIMDIIKPPPAYQSQTLKGGLGITIDDIIASLYALAINHGLFYLACKFVLK